MPRAVLIITAYSRAVVSGYSVAAWNVAEPGRTTINTPAKPANTASQRLPSTRSFRISTDSAVTNSGAANAMAVASASGSARKPR
ncbi:hypothetical protein G6F68_020797 [Rhizopus microsporus]|nr:hypothetical protein G6F68_020797 [Rhizopus microsporus]